MIMTVKLELGWRSNVKYISTRASKDGAELSLADPSSNDLDGPWLYNFIFFFEIWKRSSRFLAEMGFSTSERRADFKRTIDTPWL